MAIRLSGKEVADKIYENIRLNVNKLSNMGVYTNLSTLRVGENADDIYYENMIKKRCTDAGIIFNNVILDKDATYEEIKSQIYDLNKNEKIHGILMFRPLPKSLDEDKIRNLLDVKKDIDGITDMSLAGVFTDSNIGYPPCTSAAVLEILNYYNIDVVGKKVVVVGRSLVVGKPVSILLLKRNATVTMCHSKTYNLKNTVKNADIVILAIGRAKFFNADYFKEGQIIIDVGTNATNEGLVGDADYDSVFDIVKAITPVPLGVGSVTTAILLKNTVNSAISQINSTMHNNYEWQFNQPKANSILS